MSQFVNYVLTLGQQAAPKFGYATLGLSLERYGIDQVIANVPGAVDPTAAESQAYACGDLTPTEVQAGQTTPTCGVTNGVAATATARRSEHHHHQRQHGHGQGGHCRHEWIGVRWVGVGGEGGGVDPSVSLTGTTSMASTGSNPLPLVVIGVLLVAAGWIGRRRLQVQRRTGRPS